MVLKVKATIRGGGRLRSQLARARRARSVMKRGLKVGFFSTARYDDDLPVTNVAVWNEFGTKGGGWGGPIPERPFMRPAAKEGRVLVRKFVREQIDPRTLTITETKANRLGEILKADIQKRIRDLREPPNSPVTIMLKGSDNPLIDTGFMRQSVTYETF